MTRDEREFSRVPTKAELADLLPSLLKPGPITKIRELLEQRTGIPMTGRAAIRPKTGAWAIMNHLPDGQIPHGGIFQSPADWLAETVALANRNPAVRWSVQADPDEMQAGRAGTQIEFIGADSTANPYELMTNCDGIVTIHPTVGLEAACYGVQVVLAAPAPYSGFGLGIEPCSREEYQRVLLSIQDLPPLSRAQVHLAQAFAFQIP